MKSFFLAETVNAVKFNEYASVVVSVGYDRSLRARDCRSHSTQPIQVIRINLLSQSLLPAIMELAKDRHWRAAAYNLKRLAEEFGLEWAVQHIVPQDSLLASCTETEKRSALAARVSTWKQRIEKNLDEQVSQFFPKFW